jgi:hypothetical protein
LSGILSQSDVHVTAVQHNVHFNVKQLNPADRADGFKTAPVRVEKCPDSAGKKIHASIM